MGHYYNLFVYCLWDDITKGTFILEIKLQGTPYITSMGSSLKEDSLFENNLIHDQRAPQGILFLNFTSYSRFGGKSYLISMGYPEVTTYRKTRGRTRGRPTLHLGGIKWNILPCSCDFVSVYEGKGAGWSKVAKLLLMWVFGLMWSSRMSRDGR